MKTYCIWNWYSYKIRGKKSLSPRYLTLSNFFRYWSRIKLFLTFNAHLYLFKARLPCGYELVSKFYINLKVKKKRHITSFMLCWFRIYWQYSQYSTNYSLPDPLCEIGEEIYWQCYATESWNSAIFAKLQI